jgi:hypothetical protein
MKKKKLITNYDEVVVEHLLKIKYVFKHNQKCGGSEKSRFKSYMGEWCCACMRLIDYLFRAGVFGYSLSTFTDGMLSQFTG